MGSSHLLANSFPVTVDGVNQAGSTWPSTESNQKETTMAKNDICLVPNLGTKNLFLPSTTHHLPSLH